MEKEIIYLKEMDNRIKQTETEKSLDRKMIIDINYTTLLLLTIMGILFSLIL